MRVIAATTCPVVQDEFWRITSRTSDCKIVGGGRCVSDGDGNYRSYGHCQVQALRSLIMTTEQYDVEDNHDFVTVKGVQYKTAYSGPDQVTMEPGDTWTWESDSSDERSGFKICACSGIFVCLLVDQW